MFNYTFPAVKGMQADSYYYIAMVPCGLLSKLFLVDNNDILPEYRAQRKLNLNRIPEITNYILNNRSSYVFSALAASIDGNFSFNELQNNLGILTVSMNAKFLINDGQHRNAAIQAAIEEDESLLNETIPVVFFADKGLERSQQMFTDLNKYAAKPSKSQNTFYDHKDILAILSKKIIESNSFLRDYTDVENDTLGKFSAKLFTLNSFYNANQYIFNNSKEISEDDIEFCIKYWNIVVEYISEWQLLMNKDITKKSLREDYIVTQNIVLYALGKLGNYFRVNCISEDMSVYLRNLSKINWLRTNPMWNERAIVNGKISVKNSNINLTYLTIKEQLGIILDEKEKKLLYKNVNEGL